MALDDLKEVIETLQGIINTHHDYLFKKEARTRLVLINPLLQALGWDVSNPAAVQIEYQVKKKRADYVLIRERRDVPIAVIEAKGLGNTLADDETTQAHIYANQAGIDYMIVTDGDRWKMFKAYGRGVLEDRQIMEFQLSQDLSHECMLQALRIWNSNLASGSPKEAMKPVLEPPLDKIEGVLAAPPVADPAVGLKPDETWTGKKISAFTFNGETYEVKKWNKFLVKFCEILSKDDTLQFREVLELNPGIFSESRDSFPSWARSINEIGKTGIYVHTGINNNDKRDLIKAIVEHFGREMPVPHTDEDG